MFTKYTKCKTDCHDFRIIENLALEGGGMKGFCYLGVFLALEKVGLLQNIKRVAGSSIGAFFGFNLALGYSPKEICQRTLKNVQENKLLNFFDFIPENNQTHYQLKKTDWFPQRIGKNIYNLNKSFIEMFYKQGIFYGQYIENELITAIQQKFPGKTNLTFGELHELKLSHPELNLKDMYVTAVDLSDHHLVVLSHETVPDMFIPMAIRASMAVPGVFKPILYQGKLYADGGLKSNLPIEVFDHAKYLSSGMSNINKINMRTVGVCLSSPTRTLKIRDQNFNRAASFSGIFGFILKLLLFPVILQDYKHRFSYNPLRTIFLDTQDITVFDFKLSLSKVENAIKRAEQHTIDYVENYITNVADPHADTLMDKINQLKMIFKFYSLYLPQASISLEKKQELKR